MSMFTVDFSEAVERVLLPIDWYHVRIESMESRTAQSSGNPYMNVMMAVVSGAHEGQKLFMTWPMVGRGAGITKSAIRAFLGDDAADGPPNYEVDEFLGAEAMARVTQRIADEESGGDGTKRNNISRLLSFDAYAAQTGNEPPAQVLSL